MDESQFNFPTCDQNGTFRLRFQIFRHTNCASVTVFTSPTLSIVPYFYISCAHVRKSCFWSFIFKYLWILTLCYKFVLNESVCIDVYRCRSPIWKLIRNQNIFQYLYIINCGQPSFLFVSISLKFVHIKNTNSYENCIE